MEWKETAIRLSNNGESYGDIARTLSSMGYFDNLPHKIVYDRVRRFLLSHSITKKNYCQVISQNYSPEHFHESIGFVPNPVKQVTFGLIGDTHINSKYTQITALHKFYEECANRGVCTVYHCGDIDDGEQMRVGHEYELYNHGSDEHIEHIAKVYPHVPGITTKFITGNHDASIYKHCGCDIGKRLSEIRDDLVYLGRDCAVVNLTDTCTLELRHPWDGSSYSISYKPQKIVDNMLADERPTIVAIGHYHKAEYLPYRGVHTFQVGCFQGTTPFMRGKGLYSNLGGWIVTVNFNNDNTIKSIAPEFISFDEIKNDYKQYAQI